MPAQALPGSCLFVSRAAAQRARSSSPAVWSGRTVSLPLFCGRRQNASRSCLRSCKHARLPTVMMASPAGGSDAAAEGSKRNVAAQFKQGQQGEDKAAPAARPSTEDWLELDGKVIIITGGASGLGNACGEELAARGAKAKEEPHSFLFCDVTGADNITSMVDDVLKKYGRIDALINNAGINIPGNLLDVDLFELDRMYAVNQRGCFLGAQACARAMARQDPPGGVIVNVASEAGLEGSSGQSVYSGTKAALYGYTRSWAKELGGQGIRVIGVAPGILEATGLRTPEYERSLAEARHMSVDDLRKTYSRGIPLGREAKLSEVASVIAFLVSPRSSYLTGTVVNVSGGKSRG